MRAAFYEGHETISLGRCVPVPPAAGQAQIRVSHCGICGTDVHIYHGQMDRRVHIPQVIGHEASAEVVKIGPGVAGIGRQRVSIRPLMPGLAAPVDNGCTHIGQNLKFIGIDTPGAMQESWTVPAHTLHTLPDGLSLDMPHWSSRWPSPVTTCVWPHPGENAVVIGGGPIGLLIALVARQAGGQVLVAEVNPQRLALAREFGLATVNPKEENLVEAVGRLPTTPLPTWSSRFRARSGVEAMTQLPRPRPHRHGRHPLATAAGRSVPLLLA